MNLFKPKPAIPRSQLVRQRRLQEARKRQAEARDSIQSLPKEPPVDPHAYRPVIPPLNKMPAPVYPKVQQPVNRQPAFHSAKGAPVISRNKSLGTPVKERTRNNTRRVYAYTMAATGTEIRLPTLRSLHFGWRLVSGALSLLMIALIAFFITSPSLKVSGMSFNGLQRLDSEKISSDLGVIEKRIYSLDADQMRQRLAKKYPELANVKINITLPAKVVISASERMPLLAWVVDGNTYWIDENGYIFPARGEAAPSLTVQSVVSPPMTTAADATVLEELSEEVTPIAIETPAPGELAKQMDPTVMAAILKLSTMMPEGTVLAYSDLDGLGWVDAKGWAVYIGLSMSHIDQQMMVYKAVVDELSKNGITPSMVSVEHVNAPFYR